MRRTGNLREELLQHVKFGRLLQGGLLRCPRGQVNCKVIAGGGGSRRPSGARWSTAVREDGQPGAEQGTRGPKCVHKRQAQRVPFMQTLRRAAEMRQLFKGTTLWGSHRRHHRMFWSSLKVQV